MSLEQQREWWQERLAAFDVDPETFFVHARVGARLMPDPDGPCALAGVPRMPSDWQWPQYDGRPHKYMARVSLAALAEVLSDEQRHGLPATGTLHLFADALGDGWGYDPEHAGSFAAFIADGDTVFPTPHAEHAEYGAIELEYPERRMGLVPELVLPHFFADELPDFPDNGLDEAYWDLFDEFNEAFFDEAPKHRICGLPEIIQNPMEEQCQLVSNGIYRGGDRPYDKARAEALKPGAKDWRLLAQLDTDEDLGFFWGDTGCIYWWLREPDFRTGRVDRIWGIVQIT